MKSVLKLGFACAQPSLRALARSRDSEGRVVLCHEFNLDFSVVMHYAFSTCKGWGELADAGKFAFRLK